MATLYACSIPLSNDRAEAQLDLARAYCQEHGLHVARELRDDDIRLGHKPLGERPGGRQLLSGLRNNDVLVVANVLALGPTRRAFVLSAKAFQRMGITLRVAGDGLDRRIAGTEEWAQVIRAFEGSLDDDRPRHAEAIRRGVAKRKAKGGRVSRFPPIGHRWQWCAGEGRFYAVPCPLELAVIEKVVRWRHEGYSWSAIATHLVSLKITTTSGGDWHPRRLQRACQLHREGKVPTIPAARAEGPGTN